MLERIKHAERELAVIIRKTFFSSGIEFFTPGNYSQQLGYMHRPKGYVIPPHVHNSVPRAVNMTQEVLIIRAGLVRVDFYSDEREYLTSRDLEAGDIILLASGGHGFEMLESSEIVEVKQGPYVGESDKTRFQGVTSGNRTYD